MARWPLLAASAAEPLGNAGGFSGARLWRVGATFCLRAAPADPAAVAARHRWMREARDAGLTFVPAVVPTADGASFAEADGAVWEMQTWMPGAADYHAAPSPARLAAACTALARLHAVWRRHVTEPRPAPAVRRRLVALGGGELHRRLLAYADAPYPL
ncbi:MAG: phosphotransferase, partial [Gemmataceae bacterium]